VPGQNSFAAGWLNLNRTLQAANLPMSDGFASTVTLTGTAPNGWASGNGAYAFTPLLAGMDDYTGTATPTTLTLSNLSATFPGGYKVIAYLGGFNSNTGASISDGTQTFFYQTLNDPTNEFTGNLVQTTLTNDLGAGKAPFAQYAVFGEEALLTSNTLTLRLDTLYGGGAMLGGVQVLSPGQFTARGVPYGWFAAYNLPVDDQGDGDLDGVPAWEEFVAGTNPTNASSRLEVIRVERANGDVALTWLGGVTGLQGNWSMCASSNLTDWVLLDSQTIPRHPSGTNVWVHTNGLFFVPTLFYRPCVEYNP
jgi:hypothetical protein